MAEAGLARCSSSSTARKFARRLSTGKLDLADRHVDVAVAVGAVLDLAALELADGLADVGGDGAGLGVRHQATRAEHAAEAADLTGIRSGVAMATSKSMHAALDLRDEVVGADDVGAGVARASGGVAGGEHRDAHVLAGARRQRDGAAHHLVGLAGIDAEADGELDGLVELGRGERLHQLDRLGRLVQRSRSNASAASLYFLPFAMFAPSSSLGVR